MIDTTVYKIGPQNQVNKCTNIFRVYKCFHMILKLVVDINRLSLICIIYDDDDARICHFLTYNVN